MTKEGRFSKAPSFIIPYSSFDIPFLCQHQFISGLYLRKIKTYFCLYVQYTDPKNEKESKTRGSSILRFVSMRRVLLYCSDRTELRQRIIQGFHTEQTKSLGFKLIQVFKEQLDGELTISLKSGTTFELIFEKAAINVSTAINNHNIGAKV